MRKNYRNVTYHNWRHAFNVAQTMFWMMVVSEGLVWAERVDSGCRHVCGIFAPNLRSVGQLGEPKRFGVTGNRFFVSRKQESNASIISQPCSVQIHNVRTR